ncbi:MAG: hypothetical protein E6I79_03545 [Chloroflexi bacterium]|nr:MAG: hypothetical protein E6I79_03545 [Chloroflexota bacterium]
MEAETANSPEGKQFIRAKLFHIVLEGKYNPQYWMHIEVPAEAQLMLLDDFIRAAWVECCDHLSAFQIGEFYYESEPPSFDFSSIKILGPGETASMEVEGTTSEDAEDDKEDLEDAEDDEDYDKFDLEEEFDPMLLETIPADIVEKLRTIHSRDDASEYLREEMKVKVHAPDDKDRESIRQYFQRLDRQRAVKLLIEMIEDHSLYAELGKVLSVGQKFSYTYDFGSSTNLNLRIVSEREGLVNPKDVVKLLARNLAPEFKCSVCDAPATLIFGGAWGDGNTYCKKHAKKYEGEGLLLPIVNSPRVGVCGYDGPGRNYAHEFEV